MQYCMHYIYSYTISNKKFQTNRILRKEFLTNFHNSSRSLQFDLSFESL